MDKFMTLCWECRQLMHEAGYKLIEMDSQRLANKKCDNCGGIFFIRYCRVKNREKEES